MPQLDRLLSAMVSHRAAALRVCEGEFAEFEIDGAPRPVTKTVLTGAQVVTLLCEIAPAAAAAALAAGQPASFAYLSDDGAFTVTAARDDGRWRARITIDEGRERQRLTGQYRAIRRPDPPVAPAPDAPAAGPSTLPPVAGPAPIAASGPVEAFGPVAVPSPPADDDAIHPFEGCEQARAALDAMLRAMVAKHASDLHLRCTQPPILRLHGEMYRLPEAPLDAATLDALLRSVMPERNRRQFAASNDTDYAYELPGVGRFRANALKERLGPAAVFRHIPAAVVTVEQMGLSPEVQKLCQLTKGLVLVTGPTGSGKSTTLCALIDLVNRSRTDHVITIEDPIEFVHAGKKCVITQRQVGVHTDSFKNALRAALREDPDVILVGELRDLETVSIAIETAETGHLVFGTLHTSTAASTIDRIIDQFSADRQAQIRVMLAGSLRGVISQTLCRKLGGGGRVAAREVLLSTPAVANLIREGKTYQIPTVMQTSKRLGMVTLNDALLDLVDAALIDPAEGYAKSLEKAAFVAALKARGLDTPYAE
jgi:twitching motility protein PilT